MHKQHCHPDFLALAMDNVRRLKPEEKMMLTAAGKQHAVPNSHFCQTVARMSCVSVSDFIKCVEREYVLVRDKLCYNVSPTEAAKYPGNTQRDLVEENMYGLDVGVEALCAAINMWPGVYTVNSCSGLHAGAWVPSGPQAYFCSDYVQFVSDDTEALNNMQAVIERGGFGIKFSVTRIRGTSDPIGNEDGFLVIDCVSKDTRLPQRCRTYGRAVSYTPLPFGKLDSMLWMMTDEEPPLMRMQYLLMGFLGVALELVRANPSLNLTEREKTKLAALENLMRLFRKRQIEFGAAWVRIASKSLSPALGEVLSEMQERVGSRLLNSEKDHVQAFLRRSSE